MPTRSVSSLPRPSGPVRRVSDAIVRDLTTTLTTLAHQRHGARVTVDRLDRAEVQGPIRLRLTYTDRCLHNEQIQMVARLHVTHVGGNMYDLECAVADGPSRRFTHSLPRRGDTSLIRVPDLGRTIGAFLLDELERQVGRHHLCRQ